MSHIINHDSVDNSESIFPFPNLIETEYFQKYKNAYYRMIDLDYKIRPRNYLNLMNYLKEIFEYNEQHARGFAKSLRSVSTNWRNSEAIFAELIVYRYYIRLVYEGLIKSIDRNINECDIIIERLDNTHAYLEVFCVMPNLKYPSKHGEIVISDMKTHTKEEKASIRQKLLRKIEKQKQFTKPRDNFAVIESNESIISGDFTILSSLSSGYKITLNKETMEKVSEGYDWRESVFNDESTKFLKGIIYFSLGDYESRKFIPNPRFNKTDHRTIG